MPTREYETTFVPKLVAPELEPTMVRKNSGGRLMHARLAQLCVVYCLLCRFTWISVDFVLFNAERNNRASPVASLINRRTVGNQTYEMSEYYGTFIVRTNSTITKIAGRTRDDVGTIEGSLAPFEAHWKPY
eukprot:3896913-Pyramimonas_sp.AAC.1